MSGTSVQVQAAYLVDGFRVSKVMRREVHPDQASLHGGEFHHRVVDRLANLFWPLSFLTIVNAVRGWLRTGLTSCDLVSTPR